MKLLTFKDIPSVSIETLRKKLHLDPKNRTEFMDDKRSLKLSRELSNIAILGHTDNHAKKLGGYDAKAFAEQLAFHIKSENRQHLKDLYLIACEAGMSIDGQPALAQKIVEALHRAGFINVQVHALSSPDDIEIKGMRVELTHAEGDLGHKMNREPGILSAYLNQTEEQERQSAEIDKLQEQMNHTSDTAERRRCNYQIQQIERTQSYQDRKLITETDDLMAELSRPQNTFEANAKKQEKIIAQELLIVQVEDIIRVTPVDPRLSDAQQKQLIKDLSALLEQLRKANKDEWKTIVPDAKKACKKNKPYLAKLKQLIKDHDLQTQRKKNRFVRKPKNKAAEHTGMATREERRSLLVNAEPVHTPQRPAIKLKTISNYYEYAKTSRWHLFKAEYKGEHGDQAKTEILKKFQTKLESFEDLNAFKDFRKNELTNSKKYQILIKGQDLFTRVFSLFGKQTSSQKALNRMLDEVEHQLSEHKR